MKAKLETFLAESERSNYARILSFYNVNATQLGQKTADELEQAIKSMSVKACWFMALAAVTHNGCKSLGYENKEALYTAFLQLMKSKGWKPQTLSSLVKTIRPFHINETDNIETALQSLISRKVGNLNSKKKLNQEQEAFILEMYSSTGKIKTTHKRYLKKLKEMVDQGLWLDEPISLSVVRTIVNAQKHPTQSLVEADSISPSQMLTRNSDDYGMSKEMFSNRYSIAK